MKNTLLVSMLLLFFVASSGCSATGEKWKRVTGIPDFNPNNSKHTDGCSGGMSASYAKLSQGKTLLWRQCCVVHDEAYYYGGTREEKSTADKALNTCVAKKLGGKASGKILGSLMNGAVAIGGLPYFDTSYRWGYGEDHRINNEGSSGK